MSFSVFMASLLMSSLQQQLLSAKLAGLDAATVGCPASEPGWTDE
jgi:hypothetical protein